MSEDEDTVSLSELFVDETEFYYFDLMVYWMFPW